MTIFLDTMIWIHFRHIGEIDPSELGIAAGDSVTVAVPMVIVEELNKQKDNHRSGKVSERARSALKLVEEAQDKVSVSLANGFKVEVYHEPTTTDYAASRLDKGTTDHRIVAAILEYMGEHPGAPVSFFSDDTGARMTAKRLLIPTAAFPEKYRLAPEPDPREKEVRELKARVQELEQAIPKLECAFLLDGQYSSTIELRVVDIGAFQVEKAEALVNRLKTEFADPRLPSPAPLQSDIIRQFVDAFGRPTEEETARYKREVDGFLREYPNYLRKAHEHKRRASLSSPIDIVIANVGTAPAEDVDVWLHVPDGVDIADTLPEAPSEPERPLEPRSQSEMLQENLERMQHFNAPDYLQSLQLAPGSFVPNNFRIKRTHSYEVTDAFRRIKHGHQERLNRMFFWFRSFAEAKSFQIDYKLTAANIPRAMCGHLNVVIEK